MLWAFETAFERLVIGHEAGLSTIPQTLAA